jgi:hypothetical protein
MRRKPNSVGKKVRRPKMKLGLPDQDQAKRAVLAPCAHRNPNVAIDIPSMNSLPGIVPSHACPSARPSLRVTEFTSRLANWRGTINVRLTAVGRLAYEAVDSGLLSLELAAGIQRVKGGRKLGVRLGNWLTAEEARRLWQAQRQARYLRGDINGAACTAVSVI